jgi:dihydroneopterin aldolase
VDEIIISGLTVFAHHGVLEHETTLGQRFIIDVTVGVDTKKAAATDALEHTLNYGTLSQAIADLAVARPVKLIETLAQDIADLVLSDAQAKTVTVKVTKPQAPLTVLADSVAVQIVRP